MVNYGVMMRFFKLVLASLLLVNQVSLANITQFHLFEVADNNVEMVEYIVDYAKRFSYDKETKNNIIKRTVRDLSDWSKSPIQHTEVTNINTDGYVWKVSYSPFGSQDEIRLLNPHPTLTILNQRAIDIIKNRVKPFDKKDNNLLNKHFVDTDIQNLKEIKYEAHINFSTSKDILFEKAKEQTGFYASMSKCGEYYAKKAVNVGYAQINVNELGQVDLIRIFDMKNKKLAHCLSNDIKGKKYMILNEDGVPISYSFSITLNLES